MKQCVEILEKLSNANGAPGFEDDVLSVVRKACASEFNFEEDKMRNLYIWDATRTEDAKKPTVMLDAHSDEVAFIIQSIKSNGLLKFLPMGGWIAHNAAAQKVRVRTQSGTYIPGIVSSKPPHFMSEAERKAPVDLDTLFIDIGASSRDEVIDIFDVAVGAPVVPDVTFEIIPQNQTMIGKAFDNRIGCACVVETLRALSGDSLNVNPVGAIASQEEIGTRGAVLTARRVKPDVAIVFEGTPADDGFKPDDEAQSVLGKGPQIRHIDKSMITHPRFVQFARAIAKEAGMDIQDAIRAGGGTNGGPIHLSNEGVPTIVIGVPVRYVHTHYGISSVADYEQAIEWAKLIIQSLDASVINGF